MNAESLDTLQAAFDGLADRVAALEAAMDVSHEAPAPVAESSGAFWALDGLKSRLAEHPATRAGAVLLTGAVTLPTGEPVEWQEAAGTAGLLETDWSAHVAPINALAHPVRLELLRQVLSGVRTTAALADVDALGSTGQLHHHLRQLVAGGWLRQTGRGSYDVPAARVIPLLVTLTAVAR